MVLRVPFRANFRKPTIFAPPPKRKEQKHKNKHAHTHTHTHIRVGSDFSDPQPNFRFEAKGSSTDVESEEERDAVKHKGWLIAVPATCAAAVAEGELDMGEKNICRTRNIPRCI